VAEQGKKGLLIIMMPRVPRAGPRLPRVGGAVPRVPRLSSALPRAGGKPAGGKPPTTSKRADKGKK